MSPPDFYADTKVMHRWLAGWPVTTADLIAELRLWVEALEAYDEEDRARG